MIIFVSALLRKINGCRGFTVPMIRIRKIVGATGFEPATPWSRTMCATGLRYAPSSRLSDNLFELAPQ